jgi:hypothetical protein
MSRVLVLVEGQTEETFVKRTLTPYLAHKGIYLYPTIAVTRRVGGIAQFRGGIVSYEKVKTDILILLRDTDAALVTTMIDLYALPESFPGRRDMPAGSCHVRVAHLENKFSEDINSSKFYPYIMLHEFEALMFVSPEQIVEELPNGKPAMTRKLLKIRSDFESPEEINDRPQYAPSKRLEEISQGSYRKTLHGPTVTNKIGIDRIRGECQHFNAWIERLEGLSLQRKHT